MIDNSFLLKKIYQNRNGEKYTKTGITVKIRTNYDSVRAPAMLLSFIVGSLS